MKLLALIGKPITGIVLSGALLATQSLFAYEPEKSFWEQRRQAVRRNSPGMLASLPIGQRAGDTLAAQFPSPQIIGSSLTPSVTRSLPTLFLKNHADLFAALSPAHGSVRKVSLGKNAGSSGPVVIHIQDVHMNAEAQGNIRDAVAGLLKSGQVGLVALEGSTEDIALQPFVDFPNRKAVELTADYLLKENKISGPIHAAMTAQGKLPRILGVDDPAHYAANVQAYKDSAPKLEEARRAVKARQLEIDEQKKTVFSPALLALDQAVSGYRGETVSLGDYVDRLVEAISRKEKGFSRHSGMGLAGMNASSFRNVDKLTHALNTERSLDFKQVESERSRLIEKLTNSLNTQETNELMAQSLAYRTGELRFGDFYGRLRETCRKKGIRLSQYPAMDDYVRYVLLCDGIDVEQLLNEIASLEKFAYDTLAATPEEKALGAQSRHAWLTSKLLDFSLTPPEWLEYKSAKGNNPDLASFESFYQEAESRDTAMAQNLLSSLDLQSRSNSHPKPIALLVTGGFHAEGMANQLIERGATVISYVPKIEKVDTAQGSAYLSVFTQEKTPLEKLFQGERLFLASSPFSRNDRTTLGPALVAMSGVLLIGQMGGIDLNDVYAALGGVGFIAGLKIVHETVQARLIIEKKTFNVEVEIEQNGRLRVAQSIIDESLRLSGITAFLKSQFSRAQRINPRQLFRELIFLAPVFTKILLGWMIDPTIGPWALFLSSLTPLALTLPVFLLYHWNVFKDLLKKTPKDQSKSRVAAVYFTFVAAGFVLFAGGSSGVFALILGAMTSGAVVSNIPWIGASLLGSLGLAYGIHRIGNQKLVVPAMAKRKEKNGPDTNIIALAETHFNSSPGNPDESDLDRMEGIHHSFGRKNRIFIELLKVNREIKDFLAGVLFKSKRTLSVEQTAALLGMWIDPRVSDEAVRLVLDNLDKREFGEMVLSTLSRSAGMQMSSLRGFLYELWVLAELNKYNLLGPDVEFVHGPREIRDVTSSVVIGELDGAFKGKEGPIIVETRDRSSGLDVAIINGGLSREKWDSWVKQRSFEVQEKCEKLSKMLRFRPDLLFGEGRPRDVSYVFVMPAISGLSDAQEQELREIFTTERTVIMGDGTQIKFTTRHISLPRVLLMDDKNGGTGIEVEMAGRPFQKKAETTLSSDDIRAIDWKKNEIAQLAVVVNAQLVEEKKSRIWDFLAAYDIPRGLDKLLKNHVFGPTSRDGLTPEQRLNELNKLDRDNLVRALVRASESRDSGPALEFELKEERAAAAARRESRRLSAQYVNSQQLGMNKAIRRFQDRCRYFGLNENKFVKDIVTALQSGHAALVSSPDDYLTNLGGSFHQMTVTVGGTLSQAEDESPEVAETLVAILTDPIGVTYVDLMAQLNLQARVLEANSLFLKERLINRSNQWAESDLPAKMQLPETRKQIISEMEARRFQKAFQTLHYRLVFGGLQKVPEVQSLLAELASINERFMADSVSGFEQHFNGGGAARMSSHVGVQTSLLAERDIAMAQRVINVLFSNTERGSRLSSDIGLDLRFIESDGIDFDIPSESEAKQLEKMFSEISRLVQIAENGENSVGIRRLYALVETLEPNFRSRRFKPDDNLAWDDFFHFLREINETVLVGHGWFAVPSLIGYRMEIIPLKINLEHERKGTYLGEHYTLEEFESPEAGTVHYEFSFYGYSFFNPSIFNIIARTDLSHILRLAERLISPFARDLTKQLMNSGLDGELLVGVLSQFTQDVSRRALENGIYTRKMLPAVSDEAKFWMRSLLVMRPAMYSSHGSMDHRAFISFVGGENLELQLTTLINTMASVGKTDPNLAYGLFMVWIESIFNVHQVQRTPVKDQLEFLGFNDAESVLTVLHQEEWGFERVKWLASSYLLTDALVDSMDEADLRTARLLQAKEEALPYVGLTESDLKSYIELKKNRTQQPRYVIVTNLLKSVHQRLFFSEEERVTLVSNGLAGETKQLLGDTVTSLEQSPTLGVIFAHLANIALMSTDPNKGLYFRRNKIVFDMAAGLTDPASATQYQSDRNWAKGESAASGRRPTIPDGKASGWLGYGISFFIGFLLAVGSKVIWSKTGEISIGSFARTFAKRYTERAEDILNALVSVTVGLVAGQKLDVLAWLSLGTLSPPIAFVLPAFFVVTAWFFLFTGSHLIAQNKLEAITGKKPSVLKSIRLFGAYLVTLFGSALLGSVSQFLWVPVVIVVLSGFQLWAFPCVRARHNSINLTGDNPPGGSKDSLIEKSSFTKWELISPFVGPLFLFFSYVRFMDTDTKRSWAYKIFDFPWFETINNGYVNDLISVPTVWALFFTVASVVNVFIKIFINFFEKKSTHKDQSVLIDSEKRKDKITSIVFEAGVFFPLLIGGLLAFNEANSRLFDAMRLLYHSLSDFDGVYRAGVYGGGDILSFLRLFSGTFDPVDLMIFAFEGAASFSFIPVLFYTLPAFRSVVEASQKRRQSPLVSWIATLFKWDALKLNNGKDTIQSPGTNHSLISGIVLKGVIVAIVLGSVVFVWSIASPWMEMIFLEVPKIDAHSATILGVAGFVQGFVPKTPKEAGERAAWKLVGQVASIRGVFETVLPNIQSDHTDQIVGKKGPSVDSLSTILVRLKTDAEFRAGFVGAVQKAMDEEKLSLAQMNLLSGLVKGATGQPIAVFHILGTTPQKELETFEALLARADSSEVGGFSLALVVPARQAEDVSVRIAALRAKGVQVFEVTLGAEVWDGDALRDLERQMSTWLDQANGIVATVGTKVGIDPKDIEALQKESKLREALKNAMTLGESIETFLRYLQALASNA